MITEGHPFVIHHIAIELRRGQTRTRFEADRILTDLIEGPDDPLELGHYHERLARYLGDRTPSAEAQRLLRMLERDHYIEQEAKGERPWRFRAQVLRRWWRHNRGL